MLSAADVACLDEVIAATWPAPETEELAGWQLRFGHGFTSRANSVWPRRDDGSLRLDERIARAERRYRERGLPPKLQLSWASEPAGLDAELEARGYERSGDVLIEIATAPILEPAANVELQPEPDERWLDVWFAVRGFPREDEEQVLPMLRAASGETVFARIDELAVGRAAVHGRFAMVTSMATLPAARRKGLARAILAALVDWGRARGRILCLNVEETNVAARSLYESVGFDPVSAYWYRALAA
jgi:GNAT superfamily N-acetyltransferase